MNAQHKPITLVAKAINLGVALVSEGSAIIDGNRPLTAEEQLSRLKICISCPHYDSGNCLLCGCNMDAKTGFRSARCADSPPRWEAILSQTSQPPTSTTTQ